MVAAELHRAAEPDAIFERSRHSVHLFEDQGLTKSGRRRQGDVVALAGDHREAQVEVLGEQSGPRARGEQELFSVDRSVRRHEGHDPIAR